MTARKSLVTSYIESQNIYKTTQLIITSNKQGEVIIGRFNPKDSWNSEFISFLSKKYYLEYLWTNKTEGMKIVLLR